MVDEHAKYRIPAPLDALGRGICKENERTRRPEASAAKRCDKKGPAHGPFPVETYGLFSVFSARAFDDPMT
ncbi:MAG: hypothetical protein A2W52_00315 [Candidatus Taylorbacteria bacterium RIFCSPHIGHO2_02_49_25]|uniref:Uncharacterized protein n=1 Tax=Candidatus Taylorbacteria bacterium RIFCSPHIGHO2_02_49_25 TaxID=1802305 RepID=A0A1G2MJ85_9BACT|nr:MAG: hypothetical protein A2759_03855 [Candidatus Taylorbacteria bacterium RIFCSPHIGHO2_01_FULL_49_60]OHA23042.1 MAG: hypothetical protein A2W52_00315 [Candidatus Taylorbacteria bacterium RIFCSPHIGHO2_02_49_25]OHA35295.1 MAG: hypothetical protein A3B27_03425 [Candidatus Taylorbacteria bacterium RIFCSPLOWO2_01_FULL_50_130]OHA36379.1 MAG: hypothetical protein A2W65_02650 [Candidatus Taylorbacteria bacterium RIFCSPLOWO2_02_50_13]OHA41176.1 MAG: hypothetical protein A3H73_02865 [Candidatus Taylo